MKIGDKINTPDGLGIIKFFEEFRTCKRVCVELENNPFNHEIACYFTNEIIHNPIP
ncbi:MAG: hypothetical protein KBE91_01545 [Bacteroidia bacterium]|nr:hypothetical protein [Bacteroidia bacterium]